MTQVERFALLLRELERVGVEPQAISNGFVAREQDVLKALALLPDGAGVNAFFAQLRRLKSAQPDHSV